MRGKISSLWRYPVKGFTPERLKSATLLAGEFFPGDRLYAVEDGPSGFDPAAPAWVSKQKFTVLAKIAEVARACTSYDEASGVLVARADHCEPFTGALSEADGRQAFAAWLTAFLGDAARGPLQVLQATGHRFTDHPNGYVSVINLASVRDLEARAGRPIDPLRFRANVYVEGWPAWVENDADGANLQLGAATGRVFSPIVRCAATHVNPATGELDFDLVGALHAHYRNPNCGIYVRVTRGGVVAEADTGALGRKDTR